MICQNTGDAIWKYKRQPQVAIRGIAILALVLQSHFLPWRLLPGLNWTNSDVSIWFYLRSQVASQQSNLLFHNFFQLENITSDATCQPVDVFFLFCFFLLFSFSNQLFHLSDLSQCTDMKEKPKTGDSWRTGTRESRGYSKGRNTSGEADTPSRSPRLEGSQSHSCVMEITCWIIICTLLSKPDDQQTAQWMTRVYTIISLSTLDCALIKYDLFSMNVNGLLY